MNFLSKRLAVEISHYHALGESLKRMLLAYTLFLTASPIIGIFVNTYLWRQGGGALQIALYNLGWVTGLPFGFLLNGLLLRKIHIKYLYFLGVVLQGMGAFLTIFSGVLTPTSVTVYGLLYGLTSGVFWANRNALDFKLSRGRDRIFYNHFYYVVDLLINVITPIIIGWLIVAGERIGLYTADSAYKVLMGVALFLLTAAGWLVASYPIPDITNKKLLVINPSQHWRQVRLFHVIFNMMWGLNFFLPTLLILYFGSKEGVIGTLASVAAVLAAGTMYILGRKSHIKYAPRIVMLGNLLYLFGCLFLLWQFTWIGAAVYLMCVMIASPIRWSTSYAVIMEVMDGEDGVVDGTTDYAHVLDNEIYFNIGRVISILFFLGVMYFSLESSLKWVPLIMAGVQFFLVFPLRKLVQVALRAKIS